jgi:AcrR family transcriptional regulator
MSDLSTTLDRRTRKRLATRQAISDAATCLFLERGFEAVTIDEIAEAADVGRMTVFNHFPRKEDMFFDRDDEGRAVLCDALRNRDPNVSPVETLRRLAHRLIAERRPFVEFSEMSRRFVETVERSETLKARARAIRDELAGVVAETLTESLGRKQSDTDVLLVAELLLATWSIAFREAHRTYRESSDTKAANAAFLAIIDRASDGIGAVANDGAGIPLRPSIVGAD